MKKVVLTWWTHTWKTSILKNLSLKWYTTIDEVAQNNMKTLINLLWKENYQKWRKENFLEFQKLNIYDNLKVYLNEINKAKDWVIFYDRWIFDWIASLNRESVDIPIEIKELIKDIKYNKIFIIEHLDKHDMRNETWRMLNSELSIKWEKYIKKVYTEKFWQNNIILISDIENWTTKEKIEKRTNLILKYLNLNN